MISNIVHKSAIIKCPGCGAEYLSGEIYMPSALTGHPEDVIRDSLGKIIYEDYRAGLEPSLVESFTCEYCDKPFVIEAVISYKTKEEAPENDFSTKYVSLLD